ncbi:MAG: hypothetical protein R2712_26220 [Vicinamibacterales bacterium]
MTGRLKDLIKVHGYQVSPEELEGRLAAHPGVADVAVAGRPDAERGETPVAWVVRRDVSLAPGALADWLAARVSHVKRLGRVHFVEAIPRNAAGKIERRRLVEPGVSADATTVI